MAGSSRARIFALAALAVLGAAAGGSAQLAPIALADGTMIVPIGPDGVVRPPPPQPGMRGYWVCARGAWYFYPSRPGAYGALAPDTTVRGPPPGFRGSCRPDGLSEQPATQTAPAPQQTPPSQQPPPRDGPPPRSFPLDPRAAWDAPMGTTPPPAEDPRAPDEPQPIGPEGAPPSASPAASLESADACLAVLRAGGATVEPVTRRMAGVEWPVRLTSPLGGVVVGPAARRGRVQPVVADCRLLAAILDWAPTLQGAGIVRIGQMSLYRPGARVAGRGGESGHAHALAIDLAHFVFDDGVDFEVVRAWTDHTRGVSPCGDREGEEPHMTAVRRVVCASSSERRFNVVLTPHHDEAHANHVHLEVRPGMGGLVLM